jgi:hypothetical protein
MPHRTSRPARRIAAAAPQRRPDADRNTIECKFSMASRLHMRRLHGSPGRLVPGFYRIAIAVAGQKSAKGLPRQELAVLLRALDWAPAVKVGRKG